MDLLYPNQNQPVHWPTIFTKNENATISVQTNKFEQNQPQNFQIRSLKFPINIINDEFRAWT